MNFPNSDSSQHPWDLAFFMFPDPVEHYNGVPIHPNKYVNLWLSTCEGKKTVAKVMTGLNNPMVQLASWASGLSPQEAFRLLVECAATDFFAWLLRFPTTIPEEDWLTIKLIVSRSIDGTIEEVLEEARTKNRERQEQIEMEAQEIDDSSNSNSSIDSTLLEKLEQLYSKGDDHSSC